ncbi:MAG: hypothetical protein QOI47_603 [Actinomycetota bacterium]|jgi:hypothetical protein|nr:hypothetical protein [Actinomycetota bacterium]
MTVRATFKQLSPRAFYAECDLCGAVVDPSDSARSVHIEHHESLTGLEVAASALLDALRHPAIDLTREERHASRH